MTQKEFIKREVAKIKEIADDINIYFPHLGASTVLLIANSIYQKLNIEVQ